MTQIDHLVLFRWKQGADLAAIARATEALAQLPSQISGITAYVGGPQASPEGLGQGFDFAFRMTFTDIAARDAYLPHPAHKAVIETFLAPIIETALVFDIQH
ncbi:Dabb family protein [Lacibacterium aquatile]|uniref:Dabb family protein n=1 Tax=Lacibacterium aquatile TaxID=1168082 RepID=A0ABW5DUW8_9PROT